MPETVEAKKPAQQMVPLAELIKLRKEHKELKEQLVEANKVKENLEGELSIAKSKMEDEDVADVKKDLLKRDKAIQERERKIGEGETALSQREKAVRVKELVAEYAIKGVKLDEEALLAAEDPRDVILEAVVQVLPAEKKEEAPKEEEKLKVYESIPAATHKKMPKDMTPEEFEKFKKEGLEKTEAKRG